MLRIRATYLTGLPVAIALAMVTKPQRNLGTVDRENFAVETNHKDLIRE